MCHIVVSLVCITVMSKLVRHGLLACNSTKAVPLLFEHSLMAYSFFALGHILKQQVLDYGNCCNLKVLLVKIALLFSLFITTWEADMPFAIRISVVCFTILFCTIPILIITKAFPQVLGRFKRKTSS